MAPLASGTGSGMLTTICPTRGDVSLEPPRRVDSSPSASSSGSGSGPTSSCHLPLPRMAAACRLLMCRRLMKPLVNDALMASVLKSTFEASTSRCCEYSVAQGSAPSAKTAQTMAPLLDEGVECWMSSQTSHWPALR